MASMVIGYFSYNRARNGLLDRTFDQLTSVRIEKKKRIETFFSDLENEIEQLARAEDVNSLVSLMLTDKKGDKSVEVANLFNRYLNMYLFSDPAITRVYMLSEQGNNYHITPDPRGCIINPVLNTSAISFEHFHSNILPNPTHHLTDFSLSADDRVVFYLYKLIERMNGRVVLCLEISADAISNIMYDENRLNGLGESGESYLVGSDLLMRSTSRFHDNAVFKTLVKTEGVLEAFKGITGRGIIKDYRNIEVLSSYSPMDVAGLDWVILAEIDFEEAMIPIVQIRNNILFTIVMIALVIFGFAYFFSSRFLRPFIELKEAAVLLGQGKKSKNIVVKSYDEIGQLLDAFNKMAEKIEEQRHNLRLERLHSLESLIDGQEKERQRLSRELHDSLGQMLIALKLQFESQSFSDQSAHRKLASLFDETIDETRRISNNLMPAGLLEFGLNSSLKALCEEMDSLSPTQVIYKANNVYKCNDSNMRLSLYRFVQEGLNNAIRHADAKKVKVNFGKSDEYLVLEIIDDGKGFDVDKMMQNSQRNGLRNMKDRALLLGGDLVIMAEPGKGCTLILKIPIAQENEND